MAPPSQLAIKTNAACRLLKEVSAYEKEADAQEAKWSQMKEQGKDQYELKQQALIIDESKKMVPDTKNRLEQTADELRSLISGIPDDEQDPQVQKARETLALVEA